jgi:hypothetical protein
MIGHILKVKNESLYKGKLPLCLSGSQKAEGPKNGYGVGQYHSPA